MNDDIKWHGNENIAEKSVVMRQMCKKDVGCSVNRLPPCYALTARPSRTLWWVVSLLMWPLLIEARLADYACNAAATTSAYGTVRPVPSVRVKWKIQVKRSFGLKQITNSDYTFPKYTCLMPSSSAICLASFKV